MNEEKTIVEINGIKLEVDLRYAKRIDQFKIGDRVKLLKKVYGDTQEIYPGVIVGFENFRELPTIVIAYIKHDYSNADVKFESFNAKSKDVDLVITTDDYLPIKKSEVIDWFDRDIEKKRLEIEETERKKAYFLKYFTQYFKLMED